MGEFLFDEATHTYTLDGVVIPSVTEICAPITCGKYPPVGVVQQAAARGTRVHELCALYDMDALPDEIEAELVGYVRAWAAFCRDYEPVWTHIERPMHGAAQEKPYAGTLDRVGKIDGKTRVVDIKTASVLDRPAKISLCTQISAYEWICAKNYIPVSLNGGLGVQLMRNGMYKTYFMDEIFSKYEFNPFGTFCNLRNLYYITKGK